MQEISSFPFSCFVYIQILQETIKLYYNFPCSYVRSRSVVTTISYQLRSYTRFALGLPGLAVEEPTARMFVYIKLLKPTGHVMHQQFNIQQFYVLPTLYLCVLYV